MKNARKIEKIIFPNFDLVDNFDFDVLSDNGNFNLHFKWLNERWNLWVTLPSGEIRQAGVYPGVVSWTGFFDYGLLFKSNAKEKIDYSTLLQSEVYLITWE